MRFEPAGVSLEPAHARAALSRAAGLYVHIPFCSAICPYCDFAVIGNSASRRSEWLDALVVEASSWQSEVSDADLQFDTVYLGGGTPSALEADQLASLVDRLGALLPIAGDAWWSMEVNPEDVDRRRAQEWRKLGFDFMSLGVQALDDETLKRLGRRHDARGSRRSIETLLEADFGVVSVDLIYGLEGQQAAGWQDTLDSVAGLGPDHLSCYELTFHQGTPFGRALEQGKIKEMAEEQRSELFRLTHERLTELGYEGYEVSNFARNGARSRHNQKYWHHVPYLGLGPSAHSFDGVRRWWNLRDFHAWSTSVRETQSGIEDEEELTRDQLRLEALMTGMRCIEGIAVDELEQRFGSSAAQLRPIRDRLERRGLLTSEQEWLQPTLDGREVAESLALELWEVAVLR